MSTNNEKRVGAGEFEKAHHISTLTNSGWLKPEYTLPTPSLQFLFHLECEMEDFHPKLKVMVAMVIALPLYSKACLSLAVPSSSIIFPNSSKILHIKKLTAPGERFEGPRIRGTILPGGGDWETIQNTSASTEIQTAHLDTRYNLLTHDNHCIYLRTTSVRTGPREILEALGAEDKHGANEYKMRLNMMFECDDGGEYGWLNRVVGVASSGRNGKMVIYDAYEVL